MRKKPDKKSDPRKGREGFQANFVPDDDNREMLWSLRTLTKSGQFTRWIRNAWRLMTSLANDETEVLIELFPKFCDRLVTSDGDKLLQAIYDQQAEMLDLMRKGVTMPAPQLAPMTGKSLSAPKIAMPTFDDDDTLTVNVDQNAGAGAVNNFLDAVFGLNQPQ